RGERPAAAPAVLGGAGHRRDRRAARAEPGRRADAAASSAAGGEAGAAEDGGVGLGRVADGGSVSTAAGGVGGILPVTKKVGNDYSGGETEGEGDEPTLMRTKPSSSTMTAFALALVTGCNAGDVKPPDLQATDTDGGLGDTGDTEGYTPDECWEHQADRKSTRLNSSH